MFKEMYFSIAVTPARSTLKKFKVVVWVNITRNYGEACVCVFIPSPVRVGTLLLEVPGTPIGASFFRI